MTGTDANHSAAISWVHQKIYSDNPCLLNLHRLMAEPASPDSREWLGDPLSPDSTLANTRIHS
jgi:hypothetical protein